MPKRDFWRDQFGRGKNPAFWWLEARRLKRASDLVWTAYDEALHEFQLNPDEFLAKEQETGITNVDLEISKTCFFLIGLTIEVLSKDILIGRNAETSVAQYGHDLRKLIAEVGLSVEQEDSILLNQLSESIMWHGRYPTPKTFDSFMPKIGADGSRVFPGHFAPRSKERAEAICERLFRLYDQDT